MENGKNNCQLSTVNYQLPKGWEVKRLGEVCERKPPKKLAKEKLSDDNLVTFLPMADLKEFNHYINPVQTKLLKEVYSGYVYFEDNDVLLAKITPCFENGKLGIAKGLNNGVGFGSSEYIVFRPHEDISSEYIYYFLSLDYIRREGKARMTGAVGHKRIPVEYISNQKLIVPPLTEQKRIVKILDKAFEAIDKAKENAEKNLQNAKELFQSKMQSIFDNGKLKVENGEWEEKRLREVCERITKGSSPKWQGIKYVDTPGIIFITSENVGTNEMIYNKIKFVENAFNEKDNKSILRYGDVLTNIVGASIGRTAIFDRNESANINQAVCILRCKKTVLNNQYLCFFLNSPFIVNHLHNNEINNARANLSLTFFRELKIFIPPLNKQKRIVEKLDKLQVETIMVPNI